VAWLRENLPAEWVEGIENNDPAKVAEARKQVDYNDWCHRLGEAGYATPSWPKEYGGAGLDPAGVREVMEELDRYKVPRSFNVIGMGMGGPTIMQWGSEEMKRKLLPPLAQHRDIWCQLFSEPSAGSDVATLGTRAVRDGDEWIINGQKVWTHGEVGHVGGAYRSGRAEAQGTHVLHHRHALARRRSAAPQADDR
jgi:alkylation response protein AidB-like acyl-CoA dehydrogenase